MNERNELLNGIIDITAYGAIGYGIGCMACVTNPLATAGLAATIALIKILTQPIFESSCYTAKQLSMSVLVKTYEGSKVIALSALKFSIDTLIGAGIFATVATGVFAVKFAAVPLITLIGFSLLVERSYLVASSIGSITYHNFCRHAG